MIAAFGGVTTLNLSQNYLTEQTLIHFANSRHSMPALRTVILSQNKIIERKHKEFIERLKKMDLNVSTWVIIRNTIFNNIITIIDHIL